MRSHLRPLKPQREGHITAQVIRPHHTEQDVCRKEREQAHMRAAQKQPGTSTSWQSRATGSSSSLDPWNSKTTHEHMCKPQDEHNTFNRCKDQYRDHLGIILIKTRILLHTRTEEVDG